VDPDRLQQMVRNLLSNAVKFTPAGGRVEVTLRQTGSEAEIEVQDTGPGIKPELLPHLFEPFRQADSSLVRQHGGLGLGLAIVRRLVELHGGTVQAHSAGDGLGASFSVRLPCRQWDPAVATQTQGVPSALERPLRGAASLQGLRVLVVDDEADTREVLAVVLERCQADVRSAASVAGALEALERFKPVLLLSDIGMPEEDGYSLIRRVRAKESESGGHLLAAALTAHAREGDREQALSAGYDMYVAKPIDPEELVALVATLASRVK
jgi:CheY-like chemotaxis protein